METICMKYQSLFSGEIKKNITSLLLAELAQRIIKGNKWNWINSLNANHKWADDSLFFFFFLGGGGVFF